MGRKVLLAVICWLTLCEALGETDKNVNSVAEDNESAASARLYRNVPVFSSYASGAPYSSYSFHSPIVSTPPKLVKAESVIIPNAGYLKGLKDSYGKFVAPQISYKTAFPQQYLQLQELPAHLAQPLLAGAPNYQYRQTAPQFYLGSQYRTPSLQQQAATPTPITRFGSVSQPLVYAENVRNFVPSRQYSQAYRFPPKHQQNINANGQTFQRLQAQPQTYAAIDNRDAKASHNENGEIQASPAQTSVTAIVNGKKTVITLETKPPLPLLDLNLLEPLTFANPVVPQVQQFLPKISSATYHKLPEFTVKDVNNYNKEIIVQNTKLYDSGLIKGKPQKDAPKKKQIKPKPQYKPAKPTVVVSGSKDGPEFSYEINTPNHKETYNEQVISYNKKTTMEPVNYSYNKKTHKEPETYTYSHSSKEPLQVIHNEYSSDKEPKQLVYKLNPEEQEEEQNVAAEDSDESEESSESDEERAQPIVQQLYQGLPQPHNSEHRGHYGDSPRQAPHGHDRHESPRNSQHHESPRHPQHHSEHHESPRHPQHHSEHHESPRHPQHHSEPHESPRHPQYHSEHHESPRHPQHHSEHHESPRHQQNHESPRNSQHHSEHHESPRYHHQNDHVNSPKQYHHSEEHHHESPRNYQQSQYHGDHRAHQEAPRQSHHLKPEHRQQEYQSTPVHDKIIYQSTPQYHSEPLIVTVQNAFQPITPEYEEDIRLLPTHKPHAEIRVDPNQHVQQRPTTSLQNLNLSVPQKVHQHESQGHAPSPTPHPRPHSSPAPHSSSAHILEKSRRVIIQEETPEEMHTEMERVLTEMIDQDENSEEDFEKAYKNSAFGFPAYEQNDDAERDIYNPEAYGTPRNHDAYNIEDAPFQQYQAEGDEFPKSLRESYKDARNDNKEDYFLEYSVHKPESYLDRHKSKKDYYKMFKKNRPERIFVFDNENEKKEKKSEKFVEAPSFDFFVPLQKAKQKQYSARYKTASPKYEYDYSKETTHDNNAHASHPKRTYKTHFVEPQFQYGFEPIVAPLLVDSELAAMASNDSPESEKPGTRKKVYKENWYIKKTSTSSKPS